MAPFRERLPGAISKLGKGTALQRRQTWGGWGVGRVVDRMRGAGVCGSRPGSRMVVRGGGSGSGSVSGSGMEWRVGVRSYGKDSRRVIRGGGSGSDSVRGSGSWSGYWG